MEKRELKDFSRTQYGYTASAQGNPVGPRFLRITDIANGPIDWDAVPYCHIDRADHDKYKLRFGDVVVARTGNSTGAAALIRHDMDAVFASYLVRFQFDTSVAEPGYVGRVMESSLYRRYVDAIRGGAAQGNANAQVLSGFKIALPPLDWQQGAAAMLSHYDDLIEINNRRIKLLEKTARLIYREWFVHLRFPGHENTRIVDGVPEGWRLLTLGDVMSLKYGKGLKESLRSGDGFPVYGSSGPVGWHSDYLIGGNGIIVGRKGTIGSVYWSSLPFWPIDTTYYVPPEQASRYLQLTIEHTQFINNDAAVPGLNREFALSRRILWPADNLHSDFEERVKPVFSLAETLVHQSERLRATRDLLLPRLVNGEIEV